MANKIRVMGMTFDPNEEYKGNVVIAALSQSYQNGVTAGKREAEAQAFASINHMYKQIQLWKSTATDTTTMCFLWHVEKMLMCIKPSIAAERKDNDPS